MRGGLPTRASRAPEINRPIKVNSTIASLTAEENRSECAGLGELNGDDLRKTSKYTTGRFMPQISSRDLLLLLLGTGNDGKASDGLGGITRLQKLLFLLEKEEQISPSGDAFHFAAYKAGPYSSKLYDDLEFLENLGYLESEVTAEATAPEAAEVDKLNFDDLMDGDGAEGDSETDDERTMKAADAFAERRFRLTQEGKAKTERLLNDGQLQPVIEGVRRIKSKFGSHSLSDLLYYVYTKYPEMTVESEIKDQVLRRARRA